MKITETYTGADATAEIIIMLLGAFLLGALLTWLYNEYFTECIDDIEEEYVETEKVEDIKENIEKESFVKENKQSVVKESKIEEEDDLKIVEGIGPKIESLLKSADVKTLNDLSLITPDQIRDILREKGGERYAFHDPATWPDQAKLAAEGRMEELTEYQDFLNGGRG